MADHAAIDVIYWLKDRLRFLRNLLPQRWRKRIFSYFMLRAIDRLPARRYLEGDILSAVAAEGCRTILFVGTHFYNLRFYRRCQSLGVNVMSVDIEPAMAKWGAPGGHFVADIRQIDKVVGGKQFDAIFFNGVIGFGIDSPADMEMALTALRKVAKPHAPLIVGWNPGLSGESEIELVRRECRPAILGVISVAVEFPVAGKVQPHPHRYEIFSL